MSHGCEPATALQHLGKRAARKGQKRHISVVKHLEHARVKNYARSIYVLKTNRASIDEGVRT
jgi:hypothetical protein